MSTPYIRTVATGNGWFLHVRHEGVEHILGQDRGEKRRRRGHGTRGCRGAAEIKAIEDRLRSVAKRYGWDAAIEAEREGKDLRFEPPAAAAPQDEPVVNDAPPPPPPAEPQVPDRQVEMFSQPESGVKA